MPDVVKAVSDALWENRQNIQGEVGLGNRRTRTGAARVSGHDSALQALERIMTQYQVSDIRTLKRVLELYSAQVEKEAKSGQGIPFELSGQVYNQIARSLDYMSRR